MIIFFISSHICPVNVQIWLILVWKMNIILNISLCWWKPSVKSFISKHEWDKVNYFSLWKPLFWVYLNLSVNIFQPKVIWGREERYFACVSKYNADSLPREQFCHWLTYLQCCRNLAGMRTLPRALSINDSKMNFICLAIIL